MYANYERKYDYPLYRKTSPAKAALSSQTRRSSPNKILKPINKDISYSLPTLREFSEMGGGRNVHDVSYSLSMPGGARENQKTTRTPTEPWVIAEEQRRASTQSRTGKSPRTGTVSRRNTPTHQNQPQEAQSGFFEGNAMETQPQRPNNSSNYISITQVGYQNEVRSYTLYHQLLHFH